jgi:hypothetical protein
MPGRIDIDVHMGGSPLTWNFWTFHGDLNS